MSIALENARLFDETQRLLKETEQRAAELAVINSIQEGMAAELDFQAIVDLVGDKLRDRPEERKPEHHLVRRQGQSPSRPLQRGTWQASSSGRAAQPEAGRSLRAHAARPAGAGLEQSHGNQGRRIRGPSRNRRRHAFAREYPDPGRRSRFGRDHAGRLRARSRVRRDGSAPAQHRRRQHGRSARKCAAVRRDAAAVEGNRAARGRTRGDQQHPGRNGRRARLPGDRRPGRGQAARTVPDQRPRNPLG